MPFASFPLLHFVTTGNKRGQEAGTDSMPVAHVRTASDLPGTFLWSGVPSRSRHTVCPLVLPPSPPPVDSTMALRTGQVWLCFCGLSLAGVCPVPL